MKINLIIVLVALLAVFAASETVSVDYRIAENLEAHHTVDYKGKIDDNIKLFLRRGQSFEIGGATFTSGSVFTLGDEKVSSSFADGVAKIEIPATFAIGRHALKVDNTEIGNVVVLFNPWCPEDDVFLDNEAARDEYVLGQIGRLWLGDVASDGLDGATSISWTYDQFEVIDIVLEVFEQIPKEVRADPKLVSRALTWLLNDSEYEDGVIEGNWSGNYRGGRNPSSWTGSGAIFKTWKQNGQKPAKYGQCWVFGGTLTTALRALGVASRPLTNFRSAHDSPPYDGIIDQSNGESIWNFHVWVDAWMKRDGQSNWNAVDATPQEESDGKMQMGPAFLPLIHEKKDGDYDNKFVISEVAAAVWLGNGPYDPANATQADFDYKDVGRMMSTKKIGCVTNSDPHECREDITSEYKKESDSTALRNSLIHPSLVVEGEVLHQFNCRVIPAAPQVGQAFRFVVETGPGLSIESASELEVNVRVNMITYSGRFIADLLNINKNVIAEPSSSGSVFDPLLEVSVEPLEYVRYLANGSAVSVDVTVTGANVISYSFQSQFQLLPAGIKVSVPSSVSVAEPFSAALSFTNPLSIPLTGVILHANLPAGEKIFALPDIPKFGELRYVVHDIELFSRGHSVIAFALQTNDLNYIYGSQEFFLE